MIIVAVLVLFLVLLESRWCIVLFFGWAAPNATGSRSAAFVWLANDLLSDKCLLYSRALHRFRVGSPLKNPFFHHTASIADWVIMSARKSATTT